MKFFFSPQRHRGAEKFKEARPFTQFVEKCLIL